MSLFLCFIICGLKKSSWPFWHSIWKSPYPDPKVYNIPALLSTFCRWGFCYTFHRYIRQVIFSPAVSSLSYKSSPIASLRHSELPCATWSRSWCYMFWYLVMAASYIQITNPVPDTLQEYRKENVGTARNFTTSFWSSWPRFKGRAHRPAPRWK